MWASCHSPNTNTCQDLGNCILVLLGLIVSINLGVNTVTLVRAGPGGGTLSPQVLFTRKRHTSQPSRKQSAKDVHFDAPWTLCPRDLHPAICSHNWECPEGWEAFKLPQEMWAPWAQDSLEPAAQTICSQETIEGRPLKTQIHSELGLEAHVYPVSCWLVGPQPSVRFSLSLQPDREAPGLEPQPQPHSPPGREGCLPHCRTLDSRIRSCFWQRDLVPRDTLTTVLTRAGCPQACGPPASAGSGDWPVPPWGARRRDTPKPAGAQCNLGSPREEKPAHGDILLPLGPPDSPHHTQYLRKERERLSKALWSSEVSALGLEVGPGAAAAAPPLARDGDTGK
ncbi:spermatid maturation protein 1-like [Choloepus didactylus]|uniref:spermatid maturation protein 1-like n=1 Tax=Choloepus didactylus TaxID=27675 RepID=UPI00189F2AFA|nr:spermatid maturation protein 1-like [Choloepus didactylus]